VVRKEVIRKRLNKLDEYIDIDRKIVYDVLQNNIEDLEELKRIFAQFL
jgi:predicted regulator of amino acid metabolism with ACT domain